VVGVLLGLPKEIRLDFIKFLLSQSGFIDSAVDPPSSEPLVYDRLRGKGISLRLNRSNLLGALNWLNALGLLVSLPMPISSCYNVNCNNVPGSAVNVLLVPA